VRATAVRSEFQRRHSWSVSHRQCVVVFRFAGWRCHLPTSFGWRRFRSGSGSARLSWLARPGSTATKRSRSLRSDPVSFGPTRTTQLAFTGMSGARSCLHLRQNLTQIANFFRHCFQQAIALVFLGWTLRAPTKRDVAESTVIHVRLTAWRNARGPRSCS